MRVRREDWGEGSDDSKEETEEQAGGRLYPDPALSLPAPSLSVRGDSLCPGEFAELGAPGVAAQGGNTKTSSYHVIGTSQAQSDTSLTTYYVSMLEGKQT